MSWPAAFGVTHGSVRASLCLTRAQRSEACAFGLKQLLDERYGLESSHMAQDTYGDPDRFQYLVARDATTGAIVGDLRLDWSVDPRVFDNLYPDFAARLEAGARVVDMGGHVDRPPRQRWQVLAVMFALFLYLLRTLPVGIVYAQSRPQLLRRFVSLGFSVCSDRFVAPGWKHEWRAIAMEPLRLVDEWSEPAFRHAWRAQQGEDLDQDFWRLVTDLMPRVTAVAGDGSAGTA